ncbi:MAG: DUF1573 domain-containing protein [Bacteroidales bacterium]|nr:DUF1573 domain-containing protein [Bacteroidales bacterium]
MLVVHFVNTDIHAQAPNKVVSGIEWANTTFDFGKIPQGKPVVAEFQFKNPSMIPLIVYAVKPSCGCTVAEYTKEPIQPQKTGIIKVTFDAKDSGYFQKSVTVDTNAGEGIETLVIKGEVISS